MKLTVDGSAEELEAKGPDLVKALARRLGLDLVDLVDPDDLQKAKPQAPTLKYKSLAQLHERERKIVKQTHKAMLKEIAEILEG